MSDETPILSYTDQPPGSRVSVETDGESTTIIVAPGATWWGKLPYQILPLVAFAGCVWLDVLWPRHSGRLYWDEVVQLVLGSGVCLGWLVHVVAGFRYRHCSTVLEVRGGAMRVIGMGFVRLHRRQWPCDQIREVIGPSQVCASLHTKGALWLRLQTGRSRTLLDGRDAAELRWIAQVLRRALQLPAEGANSSTGEGGTT